MSAINFKLQLFIILLSWRTLSISAQSYNSVNYIQSGPLQQIYRVSDAREVIKYDTDGQVLYRYSNNNYGDISSIDTQNPLQLLIHYANFNQAVLLDRTLSERAHLDLDQLDWALVDAIGLGQDNNLWIYDAISFKCYQLNFQQEILLESPDLSFFIPENKEIKHIKSYQNYLFLFDKNNGLIVLDNVGQYLYLIKDINQPFYQIYDNQILYLKSNQLHAFNLKTQTSNIVPLPFEILNKQQIIIAEKKIYISNQDKTLIIKNIK